MAVAVVRMDLAACDEAVVSAAVAVAWCCFGDSGLDALINFCSYEGEVQDCLGVTEDEYNKTMKVNVITPWLLIKATAKRFLDAQLLFILYWCYHLRTLLLFFGNLSSFSK